MKIHKQGITFVLLLLIFTSCSRKQSLQWIPFSWEGDSISGIYIEKAYLYIPVNIENLSDDFTMQFDLGTYNTVFYGNPIDPYLEKSGLVNKLDSTGMFKNVCLKMGAIPFNNINVVYKKDFGEKVPIDSLHTKTPKHIGTIATDMFQDKIVIIDYKSCRLAITDSLPNEYTDLPAEKFELTDGIMRLPFRINSKEHKLMFDTGSSPFQLVTTKERALEISNSAIVDSLSGPLWWGQEITFYGFNVTKPIEFGGKALNNSKVYYAKDGLWESIYNSLDVWGITGNAYFFENTVIIDYKNKLFRIK